MEIKDKIIVVTGGALGIGQSLCRRFAQEGAAAVIIADREQEQAMELAKEINGVAIATDVADEKDIVNLVNRTIERFGRIDLFCSNAGILTLGGPETTNQDWQRIWEVNVMAHVYATRAALPHMLERGQGYFLTTASAAGLLSQIGSAPYAVTKHAAVAFAEWVAITYGDRGIKVSCLCPQGVRTRMLLGEDGNNEHFLVAGAVTPEAVASAVIEGLATEQFLILPHPEVAEYFKRKATDYDRWLKGMRKLQQQTTPHNG